MYLLFNAFYINAHENSAVDLLDSVNCDFFAEHFARHIYERRQKLQFSKASKIDRIYWKFLHVFAKTSSIC